MRSIYEVANINNHDKVLWRGVATSLRQAQERASEETNLPLQDLLAWEDSSEE